MHGKKQKTVRKIGYWGSLGVIGATLALCVVHDCKPIVGKEDKQINIPVTLANDHYAHNVVGLESTVTSTLGLSGLN